MSGNNDYLENQFVGKHDELSELTLLPNSTEACINGQSGGLTLPAEYRSEYFGSKIRVKIFKVSNNLLVLHI